MSARVSDWLLDQARDVLGEVEDVEVPDEQQVVRSFCSMRRLLEALVASADLERAA